MCPQADAEGFSRLWNPNVSAYDRLVHATQAALDRSIAFIRSRQVHDRPLLLEGVRRGRERVRPLPQIGRAHV